MPRQVGPARLGCGLDGASGWVPGPGGSGQGLPMSGQRTKREGQTRGRSSVTCPQTLAHCFPHTCSHLPHTAQKCALRLQVPGMASHGAHSQGPGLCTLGA